jgi:uncharacterized protein involved in exopolysaccharide biosynthesis
MIHSLSKPPTPEAPGGQSQFPMRGGESSSRRSFNNIHVLDSLKRHWGIALIVFIVVAGAGAFVVIRKGRPVYESHSVIYISPRFPKMLSGDSETELPYDSYVEDQIQTVTRYDILADAIAKMPESIRHQTGPAQPSEVQQLKEKLDVRRVGSTYEMSISLLGGSPDYLADIVNTVTESYVDRAKREEFYGLDSRLNTLHQERDRLQKQMDDHLTEQAQLMQQLGVATIPTGENSLNVYDSSVQTLGQQLATAHMERRAAEAHMAVIKGTDPSNAAALDTAADQAIAADASLSATRSNLNTRHAALTEEMSGLRPDHPIYQKDRKELTVIDGMISDLRRRAEERIQNDLHQDIARTRMVEMQLTEELAQKTHTAIAAAPKFQRAAALGPDIANLQKAYDAVDSRIRDLELESSSPGSIHVSSKALVPLGPEHSRMPAYLGAMCFMSLMCAVSVPILIDLLDNKIYTASDVERTIGFHPIGVLLDDYDFRSEIGSEYYFRLAAGIDHAVRNSGARTFLFTAPVHGSGTTTVVKTLGEKLRSLDLRVRVIVTAVPDDLKGGPGQSITPTDIPIRGRMNSNEAMVSSLPALPTVFDPSGPRGGSEGAMPNPVVRTLHQASEPYDVILIDGDPLPTSANTEYLARVCDATVLVVSSSTSTRQELERSAGLLERLEVAGVAVVLNKVGKGRVDRAMRTELLRYEESYQRRDSA